MVETNLSQAVLFDISHTPSGKKVALITLNKPKQLNALGIDMIDAIQDHIDQWKLDKDIVMIIIKAAGDKAFCAGGDIRAMYSAMKQREGTGETPTPFLADSFFMREYRLNYDLITSRTPVVIIGHGIVMGGGFGIFNGGTYRVVSEKSVLAMPEVCIGLYPDVGASDFLNKLPHHVGRFLALTGQSINATDSVDLGLATHFVAAEKLATLQDTLCQAHFSDDISANKKVIIDILTNFAHQSASTKPAPLINKHSEFIDRTFSDIDIHKVIDDFIGMWTDDEWLTKAQANIKYGSPLSLLIIDEQLKRSKSYDLKQVFESELVLSCNITRFSEFAEGVRALLIDKDMLPKWRYKSHHDVPDSVVEKFFTPPWEANPLFA